MTGSPTVRRRRRWIRIAGHTTAVWLPLALGAACGDPTPPVVDPPTVLVGGDVSFLPEIEDHGGTYSDAEGAEDLLRMMSDHGFGAIRLRLWHTPTGPYGGLDQVTALAARVQAAGMDLFLDIHYSDSWADAGTQTKPAAWAGAAFDALVDSVYQYSRDVTSALRAQGSAPTMVQLGNEIRGGMLWPDGRVGGAYDTPEQWDRLVALLSAGRRGVLDAAPEHPPAIVIHLDNGTDNGMCRWFIDHLLERGLDFDVIAVSFYPKWHGTLAGLSANLNDLANRYGKQVAVVETAYPWTLEWLDDAHNIFGTPDDLHQGFPATVAGQSAFLRAVRSAVEHVPGNRGLAVFYWAPEWIAVPGVPSAWENATLFDFGGMMLPSMEAFTGME